MEPAAPQWPDEKQHRLVPVRPLPMVDWYSPSQLASTAVRAVLSTVFDRFVDRRQLEALDGVGAPVPNAHDQRDTITIDYISDTGDGWNPTYSIASLISRPSLTVRTPTGNLTLPSADVVILGGDEVYPTPTRQEYEDRLVGPFETAKAQSPEDTAPTMYALPGNHDWYDGLVSFIRLFISKKWFAGWRTNQSRSYFALKLPHNWWLVGVDMQLESDIDADQLTYFKGIVDNHMQVNDSIILCVAEPEWVYQGERDRRHWDKPEDAPVQKNCLPTFASNLQFLEDQVFRKVRTRVVLAGDLHHYRRHAADDGSQKITAGGGGAFLHPTHGLSPTLTDGQKRQFRLADATWPPEPVSKRLAWGNFAFGLKHPKFSALLACAYVVLGWAVLADLREIPFEWRQTGAAMYTIGQQVLRTPGGFALVAIFFFGIFSFADSNKKLFQYIAGPLHGLMHLFLCAVLGWAAISVSESLRLEFQSLRQLFLSGLIMALGGAILGSTLFGIYLFVSSLFGYHGNESFSSLAVEGWKSFLRMQISSDGTLSIYPIGLRGVPTSWKAAASGDPSQPRLVPDGEDLDPELIEGPVPVKREGRS